MTALKVMRENKLLEDKFVKCKKRSTFKLNATLRNCVKLKNCVTRYEWFS